jgi:enoyl-[acyl-carrier-protein] reductase (NADH)
MWMKMRRFAAASPLTKSAMSARSPADPAFGITCEITCVDPGYNIPGMSGN